VGERQPFRQVINRGLCIRQVLLGEHQGRFLGGDLLLCGDSYTQTGQCKHRHFVRGAGVVDAKNLIFEGAFATGVTVGLDIKAGCDDLMLKNCVIRGGSANTELLIGITIEATNDRITIDGCEFFEFTTGDATAAILTEGAFTNLEIRNCTFKGDWSVACLDLNAAAVTASPASPPIPPSATPPISWPHSAVRPF
jgi:hypothetical protein